MRLQNYFIALFMIAITVLTWQAWPSFYESTDLLANGEGDYLPYFLSEGDQLVQQIKPIRNGLQQITLSFDLPEDQVLPEDTQISLVVRASDDRQVLEEQQLGPDQLNQFARTEVPVSLGHRTSGKTYDLVLQIDRLPENSRLALQTTLQTNTALTVNGKPTGLAATLSLRYLKFNWLYFGVALLLFSLIFVLVFLPLPRVGQLFARLPVVPLLIAPFLILASVELFNTLNRNFLLDPPVYWLSLATVLVFELLLVSLLGRVRLGIYFNYIIFAALGVANHIKLFFRGDPFVAGDLNSLTEAAQTINHLTYSISNRFLLAFLLAVIYLLLFAKCPEQIGTRRSHYTAAAGLLALQVSLFSGLIMNPNVLQKTLAISHFPWNQMVNYNQNGVIIPFIQSSSHLSSAVPEATTPPDASFYEVSPINRRAVATPAQPNIVVIMSESFADFDNIKAIKSSEPVMPFYDQLKNSPNARSGNLLVSIFGGGTCNTEFEFLTGSSMLFMADGSLPYNSYFAQRTHGLPDLLNQQGYRSVAIHPYIETFWDRNLVYPALGFSDFISLEDFPPGGLVRDFVGDQADFAQIEATLKNKKANERLFVFSVTMQNHFPYRSSEEILSTLDYNIKLPDMTDVESVELYLSMVRQSDDALRDLVYAIAQSGEPTIVLLFGDHLPGNNNSFRNFYEMLFNKNLADLTLAETQKLYETPWLIWANYSLPPLESQVLSPNFLATTLLDLTGSAKSPYFQQVADLHKDIQAMSNKMVILKNGRAYDRDRIPTRTVRQLDRYWASEYANVIAGKSQ